MQWRLPGDPFWGLPYLALVCLLRGISEDTCVCPSFSLLGRKGQSRFRESVRRGFWVTSLGTQTAALEGKDLQLLISSCPSSSFPGSGPGPKLGAVKHCAPKLPACWESTHRTDEHTEHQAQLVLRARTARSCVRSWCSSNATHEPSHYHGWPLPARWARVCPCPHRAPGSAAAGAKLDRKLGCIT